MKWFDTKEIADEATLTPEQIEYLRKPSITFMGPFNALVRQHWDLVITGVVASVVLGVASEFLLAHIVGAAQLSSIVAGHGSPYVGLITFALNVPSYLVDIFIFYFGIKHGRRLSWNRNHWNSFDDFTKSEDKWTPWGWLGAILFVGGFVYDAAFALLVQLYPAIIGSVGK